MKKILIRFWNWLISSKQIIIPNNIDDNERLLRNVFSPININVKKNILKTNAFRPPSNSDEISVNRLNHTTIDFCRKLGVKDQNPDNKRAFFGFAEISAENVKICGADIVYSPIKDKNIFHADIKIGHIMVKGEQPPSEIASIIRELTKKSNLHIDPNPNSEKWEGKLV